MPLTKCRECGQTVSTQALTCPHCGAPDPVGQAKLIVSRTPGFPLGKMELYLDGTKVGDLRNNQEIEFDLYSGEHQLTPVLYALIGSERKNFTFKILPRQTIHIEIGSGFGGIWFRSV